ncbi:MAG: Omp28 family outer membrane lipoprotein [Pirellulales bacterium]|nr:Omp28 family outer membrane lipoprotein [Pirellulales bacterium]
MMKKIIINILTIILIFGVFQSCDKIDAPYLVKQQGNDPNPQEETRKVLLEEFTGHTCINCPTASLVAHDLGSIYEDQLVLISVHAGNYAEPQTGDFTYDFRTPTGNELNGYFGISYYPIALVNRQEYSGSTILTSGNWEPAIEDILAQPADAVITLNKDFNEGTKELSLTINTEFLNDLSGTFNICAYIVEDSIIAPQKNNNTNIGPTPTILDYVHMHVLRGAVNSTWGDAINEGSAITSGEVYENTCSTTLGNWVAKNCHIVVFVINNESNEIIQVEEIGVVG